MKKALILHGTSSSSKENWFPWLKDQLEQRGYQVWVPDLPKADVPNLERYNTYILQHLPFTIDGETALIGHSSGAVAILGLLQALPADTVVQASYLVGSFKDNLGWDALKELFEQPLDFGSIKKKSRQWYFIHSDNDPYCPLEHAEYLHQQLGGDLLVLPGQKHFSVGTYGEIYRQFFYLVKLITEDAVTTKDVLALYTAMESRGVKLWLDGGWGVDALLGRQTRNHGDIDVVVQQKDVGILVEHLYVLGFHNVRRSDESNYNFVLGNDEAQFIDLHVIELNDVGNGIYGPVKNGVLYPAEALTGMGMLAGVPVRCISPEWVVKFHRGYDLRAKDYYDIKAICEKFKIDLPTEYQALAQAYPKYSSTRDLE